MHRHARFLALWGLLVLGFALPLQSATGSDGWSRPKLTDPISQNAISYLNRNLEAGQARVWVYFTDKGISSDAEMQEAGAMARSMLSQRAMERRARHGITEIRFADLPVESGYVDQIVNLGAEFRRVSRWLNAASFAVAPDLLERIGSLSFVAKIEPVALYQRLPVPEEVEADKLETSSTALEAHSLSYGGSFDQLSQISVPMCHDSGYTGQGVIIAVFDTGFRTTHDAFATAVSESRLLAEYDFVFDDGDVDNEPEDSGSAWDHGTSTWSICGGAVPGTHYGPGFGASFVVCKTEDVRSETEVEEDNWVAAVEWVDSIGADIITSSLSYSDWYTSSDYDGNTCVTTIAADSAAALGILVCNSAGNSGPSASTLGAPADADSILTVGSVTSTGSISSFSSRGPTADGRTKPEVCARGSSVHRATSSADDSFSPYGSGTSYSCPLVAGCAAIVMSAHPEWTAMQVREALMMTADNATTPDNTYGWGVINAWAAIHYEFEHSYAAGDADGNGLINISDAVYLIAYIFGGGPAPNPYEAGDADGNSVVSVSDAVYIIAYIFGGGPDPVYPE